MAKDKTNKVVNENVNEDINSDVTPTDDTTDTSEQSTVTMLPSETKEESMPSKEEPEQEGKKKKKRKDKKKDKKNKADAVEETDHADEELDDKNVEEKEPEKTPQPAKGMLIVVAVFAVIFGVAGVVLQVLEMFAAMNYYTIAISGVLFISGILFFIPMKNKVKHGLVIGSFVYYILGILAGGAAYYFLTYPIVESALVSGPFVVPFILTIIYFVRYHKHRQTALLVAKNKVLIDKLSDEQTESKKGKKVKKVRVKKYKEVSEKTQDLIKKRIKFTNKFFKKLKSKAKGKIDILIEKDYLEAAKRAKVLLGISEKDYDQQILLTVPDSFTNRDMVKYHLDVTKEGANKLYFDQAYVTLLFYGVETLFIYQANIDHRSGYIGNDWTQEFNYFDVISIETVLKYDNNDKPKYSILNAELTLSNNQKFLIHLRNQRLIGQIQTDKLLDEKEQKVLQMLKDRVRASKV